jgi:hypothetical protein
MIADACATAVAGRFVFVALVVLGALGVLNLIHLQDRTRIWGHCGWDFTDLKSQ